MFVKLMMDLYIGILDKGISIIQIVMDAGEEKVQNDGINSDFNTNFPYNYN